jgi:hypothetical protein
VKGLEISLVIPDIWQQEAVRALREGKDVVVDAPTGAGKTYIFELLYPALRGQAVFTVPTRALANDKLAEWQARGWDAGIATGDIALRLDAKVVVATLETQKGRLLRGEIATLPKLLVIDEYQMLSDPVRGVNYELAVALAPRETTQLLLLSGSVANPQDIVDWLLRIGRDAVLVSHKERPVPLDEIDLFGLPESGAGRVSGFWPKLIARALRADLGPILVFAPRRNAAEELAQSLASALPADEGLALSAEQSILAGGKLSHMLKSRVAYHHSGMSYALRAGVVEPLAKNGHLRAVVATMGLAAGINFSMRSVLVTDTRYLAGNFEREVQPDELLQMFGRAGRRGLDERGYVLTTERHPRMHNARARRLKRVNFLDWPALLAVMRRAADEGVEPFRAALEFDQRLFTAHPIALGVEHSLGTGEMPCGLCVDMERARFARRGVVEMLNSVNAWELMPNEEQTTLGELLIRDGERWRPALGMARTLDGIGFGNLCKLSGGREKTYGRELPVAMLLPDEADKIAPVKWLRKLLRARTISREKFEREVLSQFPKLTGGGEVRELFTRDNLLVARLDFSKISTPAFRDSHGKALRDPPRRENLPEPCRGCPELTRYCCVVEIEPSPAHAWRRLGLVDAQGFPTPRGIIFSFFNNGEGLAVAAALEDETYPIDELVFDLANLRAGLRFSENESPFSGRLGAICQKAFERADYPGFLEMGVPLGYGAGAAEVVRELIEHRTARHKLLTQSLRPGDIERAMAEWRSLLRHIALAPDLENARWRALQSAAARFVEEQLAANVLQLPALLPAHQQRREPRAHSIFP